MTGQIPQVYMEPTKARRIPVTSKDLRNDDAQMELEDGSMTIGAKAIITILHSPILLALTSGQIHGSKHKACLQ
ncbi:hypothetical protein SUGI_0424230 [Cryptomeria japonica]|nr:hypothetical protein SUGI_0424230 [Cryptomeria japonica]